MAAQQHFSFMDAPPVQSSVQSSVQPSAAPSSEDREVEQAAQEPNTPVSETPLSAEPLCKEDEVEFEPTGSESVTNETAPPTSRDEILNRLRTQVGCIRTASHDKRPSISTGCQTIDGWLPDTGLPMAGVSEWIGKHESAGASSLALVAAANRLRQLRDQHATSLPLVIVDIEGTFYPPAAIALGIPSQQMILVRPRRRNDWVWAIDQALRCDAVAGVWASIPSCLNDRDARRFQLAAESGKKPAFFVRRENVRGTPGFAEVQFFVNAGMTRVPSQAFAPRAANGWVDRQIMTVTLDRCRGGAVGQSVAVQIDDQAKLFTVSSDAATHHETAAMHLATQLAHPATDQSSPGRKTFGTPAKRQRRA